MLLTLKYLWIDLKDYYDYLKIYILIESFRNFVYNLVQQMIKVIILVKTNIFKSNLMQKQMKEKYYLCMHSRNVIIYSNLHQMKYQFYN